MERCLNDTYWTKNRSEMVKVAVHDLYNSYQDEQGINHIEGANLPTKKDVAQLLSIFEDIIFPGFSEKTILDLKNAQYYIGNKVSLLFVELFKTISRVVAFQCDKIECTKCNIESETDEIINKLFAKLPEIRRLMKLDVTAAYEGDPAAKTLDEIILSYPGVYALMVYRIAHELYVNKVPLLPRMMGEVAHSRVGIDIHPGAAIGESAFIDHGTGVVIGETAIIGSNVKIYQGVTLGALSFPKSNDGTVVKGLKRHPTLGNNVTIYSGATILGNINIGTGSVIGGNVWLTHGVDANSIVVMPDTELTIKSKKMKYESGILFYDI